MNAPKGFVFPNGFAFPARPADESGIAAAATPENIAAMDDLAAYVASIASPYECMVDVRERIVVRHDGKAWAGAVLVRVGSSRDTLIATTRWLISSAVDCDSFQHTCIVLKLKLKWSYEAYSASADDERDLTEVA